MVARPHGCTGGGLTKEADWQLLTGCRRILARVALDIEKDSPDLSAAIRTSIAAELAGDDAPPVGAWSKELRKDPGFADR